MFCVFRLSAIRWDAKKMADRLEASNTAVKITGGEGAGNPKGSAPPN
jgi:hypothetical protein